MTPSQVVVAAILDHIEEFLAEGGCPLTDEQAAQFAAARKHLTSDAS